MGFTRHWQVKHQMPQVTLLANQIGAHSHRETCWVKIPRAWAGIWKNSVRLFLLDFLDMSLPVTLLHSQDHCTLGFMINVWTYICRHGDSGPPSWAWNMDTQAVQTQENWHKLRGGSTQVQAAAPWAAHALGIFEVWSLSHPPLSEPWFSPPQGSKPDTAASLGGQSGERGMCTWVSSRYRGAHSSAVALWALGSSPEQNYTIMQSYTFFFLNTKAFFL